MTRGRPIGLVFAGFIAAIVAAPASASAQEVTTAAPSAATTTTTAPPLPQTPLAKATKEPAHLSVHLHGVRHGKVEVGSKVHAIGYLRPFVAGQQVQVKLLRSGHVVREVHEKVRKARGRDAGRYRFHSGNLIKPGSYRVLAAHLGTAAQQRAVARSPKFEIRYPDLDPGDRSGKVRIFNHLLLHDGYYTTHGKKYGRKTGFAVMAFRKVNGMKRTFNATRGIFKTLAAHKGRFHLKYPGAGKHVEVDISRQVMVLANHGKPQYTFHVSTGAPATPTIRGHYHFYSRTPGYNSEGMYYSVYWHGGYAIHGFASVPPYPASHGCVRNEIPDAKFAYDWVRLGMSIYVYG